MLPAWISKYVGIPYTLKGRTRCGLDCYGLAIEVLRDEAGILLQDEFGYPDHPDFSRQAEDAILNHSSQFFQAVANPEIFDLVVFKIYGIKSHIGIMIDSNHFLHTYDQAGCLVGRLEDKNWAKRFHGFYRHNS